MFRRETHPQRHKEGGEDTELCGCTEQQALRISNKWAEVGHSAYTQEDEARIDASFHADIQDIEQATLSKNVTIAVEEGAVGIQELIIPHGSVEEAAAGDVGQEHAEGDGQQQ